MNYYRRVYPELNNFPDNVLAEHCRRFAVEQGRSTCFYDRREFLQSSLQKTIDDAHLKVLEISPWDNPLLRGDNVKYFGMEDSESLRKSAVEANRPFHHVPEKIHFISPTANLDIVDETFDIVTSSHVIEHAPDLVGHLQSVSRLLNKGGVYVLIIPDKRYCFDYYRSESTITDVIDAFAAQRKNPRFADVMDFTCTHNYAILHWFGEHGKNQQETNREKLLQQAEKYSEAVKNDEYINAHNWRFTPENFGYIVKLLSALKFINLSLFRLCHTIWGRNEFIAMLEKIS